MLDHNTCTFSELMCFGRAVAVVTHGEVWESGDYWRRQLRHSAEMPTSTNAPTRCHQKVPGNERRRSRQEDRYARNPAVEGTDSRNIVYLFDSTCKPVFFLIFNCVNRKWVKKKNERSCNKAICRSNFTGKGWHWNTVVSFPRGGPRVLQATDRVTTFLEFLDTWKCQGIRPR